MIAAPDNSSYVRCEHPTKTLIWKVNSAGRTFYCYQCDTCGSNGQHLPLASLTDEQKASAREWDSSISKRYSEEIQKKWQEKRDAENARWWAIYEAHLRSPEWRELRAKVLTRAQGKCEGCGTSRAIQVHHLSYQHVGREFLFELVAVCNECHDRLHEDKRR